jgi:hypothetical protein
MRNIGPTLALAMLLGLAFAPPVLAQRNLPSDVEERMGIPPNAANRDGGRRYRNPPSDWEQRRRRAYRYDRYYDDYDRRRYRPAYRYYYR